MQDPNYDQDEISAEFSRRRSRAIFLTVPLILLAFLFAFNMNTPSPFLGVPGGLWLILFIPVLIGSYINWRCPNCKAFLGRGGGFSPRVCPNCGVSLAVDNNNDA